MGRENEVDNPPAGRGESTTKSHTNRTAVWEATRRRENAVEDAGEREKEQKRTGSPLQSLQPGMKRKKRELERAGRQGAITPRELEWKPTQD